MDKDALTDQESEHHTSRDDAQLQSSQKSERGDNSSTKDDNSGGSDTTLQNTGGIDPENEITGTRLALLFSSLCISSFIVGLDFNMLATAIPVITSEFNSLNDVGWYGSAFYVALCASQPLAGKAFTLFSQRICFLSYVALFEIGSLICALSPNSDTLIGGRAVAGLGASGIFAGGFIVLTAIIPLHKRAIWTGMLASTFAVASIVGPVIGGALTQHVSWRWCFWINLPIGGASALLFFLTFRLKKGSANTKSLAAKLKSLDAIGFALFAGSTVMLLLALQWGGTTYPWSSSRIIGLFVGFGVGMIVFAAWQFYVSDEALIPPRLFTFRNAVLLMIGSFFVNGPFQIVIYWLPVWFQVVQGASPTSSGVRYLPTVISDALTSILGSAIVMQIGAWNPFLAIGAAFVCIGGGLLSMLHPGISEARWIGYQILGGVGFSLVTNMAQLGMQASLPAEIVPVGSTTLLTVVSLSCAIFLSVGQAIFSSRLPINLSRSVPQNITQEVLSVGATEVRSVVPPQYLDAVVDCYSRTITEVFYVVAFAPILDFVFTCGTQWTSVKKPKKQDTEKEEAG